MKVFAILYGILLLAPNGGAYQRGYSVLLKPTDKIIAEGFETISLKTVFVNPCVKFQTDSLLIKHCEDLFNETVTSLDTYVSGKVGHKRQKRFIFVLAAVGVVTLVVSLSVVGTYHITYVKGEPFQVFFNEN